MPTFYLVRHGDKVREPGDPGLSTLGQAQAKKTAEYLQDFPITKIYASPYARTKETAHIISEILSLPVSLHDALKERMNWNKSGQSFEAFIDEWEYATANPDFRPASGDSVKETAERLKKFLMDKRHKTDEHIVVVTHGGTIRDFFSMFSQDTQKLLKERPLEGIQECSITKITVKKTGFSVEAFHYTLHLE